MFGEYRVAEPCLHQTLDGFGIGCFHDHPRDHINVLKKFIDDLPHVAALGIEQERSPSQLGSFHQCNVAAAHAFCRRTQHQQLLLEQRQHREVFFANWQRDQAQIETPIVQTGDNFLRHTHRHPDLCVGILLS